MRTRYFFAHVAFGQNADVRATPRATANILIEVNVAAMASGGRKKNLDLSALTNLQRTRLAGGIAKQAARDYLQSAPEFREYPVQRFIDFRLTHTPTYISIRPPPTKTLPDDSKVWRLAQGQADKLRTEPRPARRTLK